jgi:CheY-like chemotaxis protein
MARILVVDDDHLVRLAVKSILQHAGHTVVPAECGHDGAAAIEAFGFDLAIVDIFTPGMNGLETIRLFRQSAPRLQVVVLFGSAFSDAAGRGAEYIGVRGGRGAVKGQTVG